MKVPIDNITFAESEYHRGKRVNQCSLEYPIILDEVGQIADGYHRLCKAILEGKETIKAIRLLEMPAPDRISEE